MRKSNTTINVAYLNSGSLSLDILPARPLSSCQCVALVPIDLKCQTTGLAHVFTKAQI